MRKFLALILFLSILCSGVPVFAATTAKKVSSEATVSTKTVAKKAPSKAAITIIDKTATINRGSYAAVTIKGEANTAYTLFVQYGSGKSKTARRTRIGTKTSNANGTVSWIWKVGIKSVPGQRIITITGGGRKINTLFTITK